MNRYTMSGILSLSIALLVGSAPAQETLGTTAVGTTSYPTSGYEMVSAAICAPWRSGKPSTLDATNNVMYIADGFNFTKLPLPVGSAAVQTVELNRLDSTPADIAVDPVGGFLYIATSKDVLVFAIKGRGEKPVRIGHFDPSGNGSPSSSVHVNTSNGDLFVATIGDGFVAGATIFKYKRGSGGGLPTLVGSTTLPPGENFVTHAFIDAASGYGVFAVANTGGGSQTTRLVKVQLGAAGAPPVRLASSTWTSLYPVDAVVGYAPSDLCYISRAGAQSLGQVLKFDVSGDQPIEVSTFTASSQFVGTPHSYNVLGTSLDGAYVVTATTLQGGQAVVRKIETASMTDAGSAEVAGGSGTRGSAEFNASTGRAYLSIVRQNNFIMNMPNRVFEVEVGGSSSPPTEVSFLPLPGTFDEIGSVAVDTATGHAFVAGITTFQRYFSKVGYFPGITKPPEFSSTYWEESLGAGAPTLAFDPLRRKLYRFGSQFVSSDPEVVLEKFEPGSGGNVPTLTSSLRLSAEYSPIAFDFENNEAYFGHPQLKKVRLGLGDEAPTLVSMTPQLAWFATLTSSVVDPLNRKLYAAYTETTVKLAKFSLGEGDAPPSLDGSFISNSGEVVSRFIALDPEDGYGILRLSSPDGRFVRFSVDGTTNAPAITGVFDFPQTQGWVNDDNAICAYLDTEADELLLACGVQVHRIATGGAAGDMTYRGATTIEEGQYELGKIVPSGPDEYLVGTVGFGLTGLLKLAKRAPTMKNRMRAVQVKPTLRSQVDDIRFYSHAAKGKLRFAIYTNTRDTVWNSPEIVNTVAGGEVVVPISSGTPDTLMLNAGVTYYLGFVSDSDSRVASYVGDDAISIALVTESGPIPDIPQDGLTPPLVAENWSIHATVHRPPGIYAIQVFDGDGASSPQVGFTNQRDVLVVTGFGDPQPEMLEISDDSFATSTIQPYAQTLPFTITRTTDGPFTIKARGVTGGVVTNVGTFAGTFDTVRPSVSLAYIAGFAPSTGNPTTGIRMTMSETTNRAPDPTNPAEVTLTNCTAGPATQVATDTYEFTITHLAQGQVRVAIPPDVVSDRAGNLNQSATLSSFIYDTIPPTASISLPLVKTGGGNIEGTYSTFDAASPITARFLHARRIGGDWQQETINTLPGNRIVLFPVNLQAGTYHLLFRAIDQAGNESAPAPTGSEGTGMTLMHYNPTANAPVAVPVSTDGAYFFAMEDDVLVRIDLAQVIGSGTLTVSREEGDLGPFAGSGEMIHERLNISYTGFTFGSASLNTSYQDDNLGGLNELSIYSAARIRGTSAPVFYPVTLDPSWNRITVNGITSLRDSWYFGRMSSPAENWTIYE